jgi:hypothetical protein
MKHAADIGSADMVHVPSSIIIGSAIQKLTWKTHKEYESFISLIYFSKQEK